MTTRHVAVLITSHNRRETTLRCLQSLKNQEGNFVLDVILVDDGSADATAATVGRHFPHVKILIGDGTLFWGGAMRLAHDTAAPLQPDFYLWLNDDVVLVEGAVQTLLETYDSVPHGDADSVVVGALRDPLSNETTYSGLNRTRRFNPLALTRVVPEDAPKRCLTMNGNVVLISRAAAAAVGGIANYIVHRGGDTDFGLRLTKGGGRIWLAPGFVGFCPRNSETGTYKDEALPLKQRLRLLHSPKGLPTTMWLPYVRQHAGAAWPIFFIRPYGRILFTWLLRMLPTKTLRRAISRRTDDR